MLLFLSLIINIAVSQNYASNIASGTEGYSITNVITYWLVGEDNWSLEVFKNVYNISTYISLGLLFMYGILLVYEENKNIKEINK